MSVRFGLSAIGALGVAGIHFWAGRQVVRTIPARVGSVSAVIGAIAVPVVLGTTCVILVNLPMPPASLMARLTEAGFWLFAAVGAFAARRDTRSVRLMAVRWVDGAVIVVAVLAVRFMARGIAFTP